MYLVQLSIYNVQLSNEGLRSARPTRSGLVRLGRTVVRDGGDAGDQHDESEAEIRVGTRACSQHAGSGDDGGITAHGQSAQRRGLVADGVVAGLGVRTVLSPRLGG